MKIFNIFKDMPGDNYCVSVRARNEREALKKYRNGLLTTGEYTLVGNRLITSYGAEFYASETTMPPKRMMEE